MPPGPGARAKRAGTSRSRSVEVRLALLDERGESLARVAGAEQLAAIIAGMTSLGESTARCFALGGLAFWRLGQAWQSQTVGAIGLLLYPLFPLLITTIGAESALFFGGGFMANVAIFSTLPQRGDLIVHDAALRVEAHAKTALSAIWAYLRASSLLGLRASTCRAGGPIPPRPA